MGNKNCCGLKDRPIDDGILPLPSTAKITCNLKRKEFEYPLARMHIVQMDRVINECVDENGNLLLDITLDQLKEKVDKFNIWNEQFATMELFKYLPGTKLKQGSNL